MAKVFNHNTDHQGWFDLNKQEIRNVRLQNLGADPGSPVDGLIIYRTDTDKVRVYINGAWVDMATMDDVTAAAISSTLIDAKGDLIVGSAPDTAIREAVGVDGTLYFADSTQTGGHLWRVLAVGDLANDLVTYAKIQNVSATDRLLGRDSGGAGDIEELAVTGGIEFTGSGGIQSSAHTGDVTKAAGGTATTIAANAVTNAKLAQMVQATFKGRAAAAGTGDPVDLTISQVKTALAYVGTDVGFTPAQNIAATNVQAAIEEAVTDLTALINTQIEARVWKDPVDAMTTAALPALTYSSAAGTLTENANAALAAQDGVTLAAGDTLLVKDQASSFQNGIYTVTQVGSGALPFILTRVAEASTAVELRDATVLVGGGTTGAGDIYTQTAAALADLTAATQTWTKTGEGNTTYTADGTTIELVGNSFRIATGAAGSGLTGGGGAALDVNTGAGLEVSADAVRIAAAAAGAGLTGGAGSALAVGAGTGITVNADDVAVDTAVVVRKAAGALTGGATSEVLTHNLNTRDVAVTIRNNATPWDEVLVEVEATTVNTVTIRGVSNLPASYRWLVVG